MVVKGYEVVGTKVQSERWGQVDRAICAWAVTPIINLLPICAWLSL
jgi:hypothetical protein